MLTVTDLFCGGGGSSTGAVSVPGVQIRMAANHWQLAVDVHNTNHPDADHAAVDLHLEHRHPGRLIPPCLHTGGTVMPWEVSWRADPAAVAIADRHYSRQQPGTPQFVKPGRCFVLTAPGPALWVTSWPFEEYVKHDWPGAWENSWFRREGGEVQASDMIRAAIAATRCHWPAVPPLGMVTFVDPRKVRHKRDPGRCYRHAGFSLVGETKTDKLLVWQLLPSDMPDPEPAIGFTESLWEAS